MVRSTSILCRLATLDDAPLLGIGQRVRSALQD
jgi:hypothetical protein